MNEFGNFTLGVAWLLTLIGMLTGIRAALSTQESKQLIWLRTTQRAVLGSFLGTSLSLGALAALFYFSDYTNQYVWQYSNRDMEWYYRISAIWGGMSGSMLLWAFFLAVSSAAVAFRTFTYPLKLMPWTLVIVHSSLFFFLTIVFLVTNPFGHIQAPFIPPDGNGLNPLLQNPYMAIHPPMLYLGFTTFAIPYAFALGALLARDTTSEWIRLSRYWTLAAWGFLTVGITLGGYWAYIELGWGGFWAWDPVENSSFLPWLTGTAFLHSVMVQERKGMLKAWNIWLVVLTYGLTVFGTFLTRSGVVQSVHAFASTDVGWVFLLYLSIIFLGTLILTFYRRAELRPERALESFFSREAAFIIGNLLFLSIMFATLWGVMFPVFSEALTGTRQAVSIPFFNTVNMPLFLTLIFFMGVGPLLAWRKASLDSLKHTFLWPFILGFVASISLLWSGIDSYLAVISYGLCFFVALTLLGEFHRGIKVQRRTKKQNYGRAAVELVRRHTTRYGAYLVHFGVLVAAIGITASMAHKTEMEFALSQGKSLEVGRFVLSLKEVGERNTPNYGALYATVKVSSKRNSKQLAELHPELRRYRKTGETTTEVALLRGLREDLYVVLAGLDETGKRVTFKLFINPLQAWLWIGVAIMTLGALLIFSSKPRRRNERSER
ncbi:MAG: heme lyase CcmF/NrfE family subunit [Bdellovibrionales bacterium]|nr:heme lyase CcmF/NrfE family subunit [Bdellovibrionales bacterium]